MNISKEKEVNLFLGFLVFTLIGNICADYALLWYGLSLISNQASPANNHMLTYFYVGQAIGVVVLAPILSVFFDRLAKLKAALLLDGLYVVLLILMMIFFKMGVFSSSQVFIFSAFTSAVAIVHRSSIAFAAIQKMSEESGLTGIVPKFMIALNLPFLIGTALSGFVFQYFGFSGCMLIGMATFIPMPIIYLKIFKTGNVTHKIEKNNFINELKTGIKTLGKDPLLLWTALSIATVNIASAVLPAIVGFYFLKAYPNRTDYASLVLSFSTLVGILLTKNIGRHSKFWSTRFLVPYSVLIPSIGLIFCLFFSSPFWIAGVFLFSCIGAAIRSVSSGSIRVKRVSKKEMGRVNTIYSALLYIGQSIGGVFIVSAMQNNISQGIFLILGSYGFGSILSLVFLPKENLETLLEGNK